MKYNVNTPKHSCCKSISIFKMSVFDLYLRILNMEQFMKITWQILSWIKDNFYAGKWKFRTFWDANYPQSTCCPLGVKLRLWIWTKLDGSVVVLHLLLCVEPAMNGSQVLRLMIESNNRNTIYDKTFIYIIHTLLCSTMQCLISSITGCFLQILLFMSNIENQF